MSNKIDDRIKRVFISSGEQKILEYLSFVDEWKTIQEIKKASQLSKAAVYLILDKLFKLNLLERDQKGKTYLYRVSSAFPILCVLSQFKVLNNLINLLPLLKKLIPVSQKIILFGSASRGEDLKNSDIDIFVVAHNIQEVNKLVKKHSADRKIQLITRAPIDYIKLEQTAPAFYNEINSGIVVWERENHYAE
ncbi:MAG: nucleotidyltransferase domain-containing protein [Patescibacteria group bacterium]|nr:nucleotidyltransferase domain-containing protein [Patescibacteria group bacterium]